MAALPDHLMPAPVGRERLPREVLEGHQRDRVLAAAAGVFAERGYNSTTVDDLVSAARIGVGSFYSLFAGKEECFLVLYDRIVSEAEERIAAAIPAEAQWPDRFYAGLRELLELLAADPDRARVVIVEANTAGPAARARYSETFERAVSVLRGERATAGGLAWLLHRRLTAGDPLPVDELLPEMTKIVLEPNPA